MTDTQAGLLPWAWQPTELDGLNAHQAYAQCLDDGMSQVEAMRYAVGLAVAMSRPALPADAVERAVDDAMKHFHFPAGDARYQAQASINMRRAITEAIRQASGAVPAVPEDVVADAGRWRALLAGDRMRIMGWAGFDKDGKPRDGMYLHFGMEFWTEHDAKADPACAADTARCRTILTGYADRLAARPKG